VTTPIFELFPKSPLITVSWSFSSPWATRTHPTIIGREVRQKSTIDHRNRPLAQERDFALLEIAPIESSGVARPAVLSAASLAKDDPLTIIPHPLYLQKQITRNCGVVSEKFPEWATQTPGIDFSHNCDTEGGSSGAPVFNSAGQLVGLHHHGHAVNPSTRKETDQDNKAVRIDRILEFLDRNRANNGGVVDTFAIVR